MSSRPLSMAGTVARWGQRQGQVMALARRWSSHGSETAAYPYSSRINFLPPLSPLEPARPARHVMETVVDSHRRRVDPMLARTRLFDKRDNKQRVRPGSILSVESYNNAARLPNQTSTFSGLLMAVRRRGMDSSFTLRTILLGTGIEMRYSLYSNMIRAISILYRASGRRDGRGVRTVPKTADSSAATAPSLRLKRPGDGTKRYRRAKLYYLRNDNKKIAAVAGILKKVAKGQTTEVV